MSCRHEIAAVDGAYTKVLADGASQVEGKLVRSPTQNAARQRAEASVT